MASYTMEMSGVINDPSAEDTTGLFGGSPTAPAMLQNDTIVLTITINSIGTLPNNGSYLSELDTSDATLQNITVNIAGYNGESWTLQPPVSDSMYVADNGSNYYAADANATGYTLQTDTLSGVTSNVPGSVSEQVTSASAFFKLPVSLNNPFPPPALAASVGGSIYINLPGADGGYVHVGSAYIQSASLTTTAPPPANTNLKHAMGILAPVMNVLAPALSYGAQLTAKSPVTANALGALGLLAAVAGVTFQLIKDNDPPDPDWQSIATPVTPPVDTTGLSTEVASGLTALAQLVGLCDAMDTTYNRLSTAYSAGNGYWEQQQLAALQSYEAQAAGAATALAQALPDVASFANTALAGASVTTGDISTYQAQFTAGTLPSTLASQATALGLGAATQQAVADVIAGADPQQTASLIADSYSDPAATQDVTSLAGSLQAPSAPCFAAGTRIATPSGDVPVEHLRPGDLVLTLGGAARHPRPVRWVGHVTVDLARHPRPARAAPIRICRDAIAEGVPSRDLLVSPDHALLFDGMLIHAQALQNGRTIVQEFPRRITYWHVELARHAVLLADGLPAESYLDLGNRGLFDGEPGTRSLHPDLAARAWDKRACAPLLLGGERLRAVRKTLCARAAIAAQGRSRPRRLPNGVATAPLGRRMR